MQISESTIVTALNQFCLLPRQLSPTFKGHGPQTNLSLYDDSTIHDDGKMRKCCDGVEWQNRVDGFGSTVTVQKLGSVRRMDERRGQDRTGGAGGGGGAMEIR